MTKEELKIVLLQVDSLYPKEYDFTNKIVLNMWGKTLSLYEKKDVEDAVEQRYCIDSKHLNFGDLIAILNNTTKAAEPTAQEIYTELSKLVGKWGAGNKHKAYEQMTGPAKKVANAIGWYHFCSMDDSSARWAVKECLPAINERLRDEAIVDPKLLLKTAEEKVKQLT